MTRVSSYAAQTLQRLIIDGHYRAGDLLPSQRALALMLGINRSALREAVEMLEALGLVRRAPGKGVLVCGRRTAALGALPPGPDAIPPQEVLQFRILLEPAAAACAAAHIDAAGLERLHAIQQRLENALDRLDLVGAAEADLAFHLTIAQHSGQPLLAAVITRYERAIAHNLRLPFADASRIRDAADEHVMLLSAIQHRAPQAAFQAMQQHLLCTAERLGLAVAVAGAAWPALDIAAVAPQPANAGHALLH